MAAPSRRSEARWLAALALGAAAAAFLATAPSNANPDYLQAFKNRYPTSTLPDDMEAVVGVQCYVCHNPSQFFGDLNCYRKDLILRLRAGRSIQEALADIEHFDSDGDGVDNLAEILAPRSDGADWGYPPNRVGFNPGLVGPLGADPCYSDPLAPQTFRPETPVTGPVPCNPADIAATDGSQGPDAQIDNGDFSLFFTNFFAAICAACGQPASTPCSPADIAGTDGSPGSDACVNNGDFSLFFTGFFAGCP